MIAELKSIEAKLNDEYKRVYIEYLQLGYPSSQAKEFAKSFCEAISKVEMGKLNMKYPGDLLNQSLNIVRQKSGEKGLGMIGL
jgi:hypothetical protein